MRTITRKSAPGVRNGKVRKKNRTARSPDIFLHQQERLVIQRIRPARGYRHVVTPTEIRRFVSLIPDWHEVAGNVKAIVLTCGGGGFFGTYHSAGIIQIAAWPHAETEDVPKCDRWLLEKMGFELGEPDDWGWDLALSPPQARCILLLGAFLHELGHHVDRMSTRSKADPANGEPFAIAYEHRRQKELWESFCAEFGRP